MLQLKSIARKYKSQYLEMSEQLQGLKDKAPEAPNVPAETTPQQESEIPVAEQNRLRQEGRQLMETEMNDRVKQFTDQVKRRSFYDRFSILFEMFNVLFYF